ncbi:MAG: carboxypeptidase-like regulatory domain-containing protein [Planctomycetaceae bacterium]|nr:carboxypeptidase-like regulatory domain-containing protein [Planctomycetaceae bacterium]
MLMVRRGMVVVAAVIAIGCGRGDGLKRAPITGVLTVDGAPVAGASLQFFPKGGTPGDGALGVSDANGKFEVISSRRGDTGIPPGEYAVMVSLLADPDGTPLSAEATQADHPFAQETVPPPYSGADSPLKVTITEQGGEVKVEIPAKLRKPKGKS